MATRHRHAATVPTDPFATYGSASAFGVGMLHGIGAETPTQVLVFLTAVGAGGGALGVLLLGCFLVGLFASNSMLAVASTYGFVGASRRFSVYAAVSLLTAAFSLVIGVMLLSGNSPVLPAIVTG